jgi:superfamily II DNA/RNA helicase
VQRKALPIALAGMDLVCMARTGSGKTCVFLVPMLHKLQSHQNGGVRGLVLSPTRELAAQTFKFAKDMVGFPFLIEQIFYIFVFFEIQSQFSSVFIKAYIYV